MPENRQRRPLAPVPASRANVLLCLAFVVGKQALADLLGKCSALEAGCKVVQRAVRHFLPRARTRRRRHALMRKFSHLIRRAATRRRAETLRAVDANMDTTMPPISSGARGSINGKSEQVDQSPPYVFAGPRGKPVLMQPHTPRPVPDAEVVEVSTSNRYGALSVDTTPASATSMASTATRSTRAPDDAPRPPRAGPSRAGSSSSSLPSLRTIDYERHCKRANDFAALVDNVKPAVQTMLPEIKAPPSQTQVNARRAGRPHL